MPVNKHCNVRKWTYDQKRNGENSTITRPHNRNSEHVERTSKRDTCNNWNHLKITLTIPEKHMGKHEVKELQKKDHIGHCTHTTGNANIEV
jgi:hypothetical protein